jgi:putative Mn2+ efflux pump MntP
MRIEENIRDTKCPHYGFGLKNSITRSAQRMNILLLIAAIATLIAWLAGLITTYRGKAADFQTHSAKFTSVLSLVFLGRRVIKKGLSMNQREFEFAINLLYQCAIQTQKEKPRYA